MSVKGKCMTRLPDTFCAEMLEWSGVGMDAVQRRLVEAVLDLGT